MQSYPYKLDYHIQTNIQNTFHHNFNFPLLAVQNVHETPNLSDEEGRNLPSVPFYISQHSIPFLICV